MLAQDLIRKDIELVYADENITYTSEQIQNTVNYLKHEIYKILDGKTVGKIVYINTADFLLTVAGMRATWELGAAIWLNDTDPKVRNLPYFQEFYKVIDVAINHYEQPYLDDLGRGISMLDFDPSVPVDEFLLSLDQSINENTIAYYSLSSGTTGDPKAVAHSHYQTVTISNFLKNYLDLGEQSRPLHYKTLHHSSLFNSFALPLFNSCKTHYFTNPHLSQEPEKIINGLCKLMHNLTITNFLVPYNWIGLFSNVSPVDFKKNLTLCCIIDCDYNNMQALFDNFNVKQVVNYFGCSEIGTMFTSRITHHNVKQYTSQMFDDVTSYIDYELYDDYVKVKWKHQTEWVVLKDKITKEGTRIWFHGRSLTFESNNQKIILSELEIFLREYLQTSNFTLVPDYKKQKLYLALYNSDDLDIVDLNNKIAHNFGQDFVIADWNNFVRASVLIGMKSSLPFLQWFFQNKNKTL